MKHKFWTKHLCVVSIITLVMPTDLMKLEAAVPTNLLLTQAQSSYDRYMQLGYDATRQRNYSVATLFFYIPHTDAQTYALIVQNENNQTIYSGNFNISRNPGIVSLSLPANSKVPELKVGKNYSWFLSVVCNRTDRSQDSVVKGSIQRIEPEQKLRMELAKVDIKERAAIYAMSGFLPDALTTLAQLRRERPNDADLKTDWEDLLRSAGLEGISQAPLVQCCNL